MLKKYLKLLIVYNPILYNIYYYILLILYIGLNQYIYNIINFNNYTTTLSIKKKTLLYKKTTIKGYK